MSLEQYSLYGFGLKVNLPYAEAVEQTKAVLKEQRGVDFRPYVILGACNPLLAEQALAAELDLGLLLPCNVIVYETEGGSIVQAMDPEPVLGLVGNPRLEPIAREVKARLQAALTGLNR